MQETAARARVRSMSELTVAIRSTAPRARTDLLELFSRRWAGLAAFNNTDVRRNGRRRRGRAYNVTRKKTSRGGMLNFLMTQ